MGREVPVSEFRDILKANGIEDADIVHAGETNNEVIIRTVKALDTAAREKLLGSIYDKFDLAESAVLNIEQFGLP
jgi:SecD/SecF fusion protein